MSNLLYALFNGFTFVEFSQTQQFEQLLGELGLIVKVTPWSDVSGFDDWGCEMYSQVGLRYDLA